MSPQVRNVIRALSRSFGYAVLDLKKDQATGLFLPGHLKSLLETLSINCVIDVGANRGDYAAMLRSIGYIGLIISVEPLPDVYAELAQRASVDPLWRVFNYALGDEEGIKDFNVFAARDLSSFLAPTPNMHANIESSEVIRVQAVEVKRLDSIVAAIAREIPGPRIFLKLDTQGYDLEVMKGAVESLLLILGIQSEISVIPLYEGMPDYVESLSHYKQLGFEPTGFYTVVATRETGRSMEFDVVLIRAAGRTS